MRITPEDPDKARIRSELKAKPKSKAECDVLKSRFNTDGNGRDLKAAYNALTSLPKKERNELNTFHFFSNLIDEGRQDLIDLISENGTKSEKIHLDKLIGEHNDKVDLIQNNNIKFEAPPKATKTMNYFSQMKHGLNALVGRKQGKEASQVAPGATAAPLEGKQTSQITPEIPKTPLKDSPKRPNSPSSDTTASNSDLEPDKHNPFGPS